MSPAAPPPPVTLRRPAADSPVVVVAYDHHWPVRFAAELARLTPLLPGADIHHIGSTAVPGLAAKPVIDLIALVRRPRRPDRCPR